jgi:CysZ protein
MKAIQNHIYGIKTTFETLSKGKFWPFFIPGAVVGLWYFWFYTYTQDLSESASSLKSIWLFGDAADSAVQYVIGFAQSILLFIFQFVVLTVLSPFNSVLSEKFDTEITGQKFESDFIRIMNDVLRAILVAIIAIILEFFFVGVWWIISLILPFSDILDPIMNFLIGSFFFGFAFYDYSLERHGVGTFKSLGYAFSHMGHMILTGSLFQLIFTIPIVGIVIAPVLMTMISTGVYIQLLEKPATPPETL